MTIRDRIKNRLLMWKPSPWRMITEWELTSMFHLPALLQPLNWKSLLPRLGRPIGSECQRHRVSVEQRPNTTSSTNDTTIAARCCTTYYSTTAAATQREPPCDCLDPFLYIFHSNPALCYFFCRKGIDQFDDAITTWNDQPNGFGTLFPSQSPQ